MQSCVTLYTIPLWSPSMSTCRQIHIVSLPYSKTRPRFGRSYHKTHSDPAAAGYRRDVRRVLARIAAHRRRGRSVRQQRDLLHAGHPRTHQRCRAGAVPSVQQPLGIRQRRRSHPDRAGRGAVNPGGRRVPLDHRRAAAHPRVLRLVFHAHILHGRYPPDLPRHAPEKGARSSPRSARCDRPRTLVVGAGETGSLAIGRMASKAPAHAGHPHRGHRRRPHQARLAHPTA